MSETSPVQFNLKQFEARTERRSYVRGYNNWNMAATSEIISDQPSTSGGYEVLEENECNILDSYEQQDIADGLQVCNQILESLQIIKGPASK